eukprot:snap_masked-scaffold256_size235750-processed-gene-1.21 protein:Tk08131 transcript:snap_masked-scaffold256_size235750-processed-gene-1.21-mRNA-1 annotation:"zinc finger protein"
MEAIEELHGSFFREWAAVKDIFYEATAIPSMFLKARISQHRALNNAQVVEIPLELVVAPEDIVPEVVALREIAPVYVAPVDVAPQEIVPVEVAPDEVAPVYWESVPQGVAPMDIVPLEVDPMEIVPVEVDPMEIMPVNEAPVEIAPTEFEIESVLYVAPGESVPQGVAPMDIVPLEVDPMEIVPVEVDPMEIMPVNEAPVEIAPTEFEIESYGETGKAVSIFPAPTFFRCFVQETAQPNSCLLLAGKRDFAITNAQPEEFVGRREVVCYALLVKPLSQASILGEENVLGRWNLETTTEEYLTLLDF